MSLALLKQLEITKDFKENKDIMMKEAVYQFPNETPEHAYSMLLRKYIDTEIMEVVVKQTMDMVDINNGLSSKEVADMMLEGVLRSHHYLQGEFWNTIIHLMKSMQKVNLATLILKTKMLVKCVKKLLKIG